MTDLGNQGSSADNSRSNRGGDQVKNDSTDAAADELRIAGEQVDDTLLGAEKLQEQAEIYDNRRVSDDRSLIAIKIINIFQWSLLFIASYYLLNSILLLGCTDADGSGGLCDIRHIKIEPLVDLVKTVLLPIITLVLGFYFGQKSDRRGRGGSNNS